MSPRTGRPTDDPKKSKVELRLSQREREMLLICCEKTGLSKSDVIRQGIELIYKKVSEN